MSYDQACPFCKALRPQTISIQRESAMRKCTQCGQSYADKTTPAELLEWRKQNMKRKRQTRQNTL